MISHRCKNCKWWDNQHPSAKMIPVELSKGNPGFCRKHKPGAILINQHHFGVQPVMDAEEFCAEFRQDQGE